MAMYIATDTSMLMACNIIQLSMPTNAPFMPFHFQGRIKKNPVSSRTAIPISNNLYGLHVPTDTSSDVSQYAGRKIQDVNISPAPSTKNTSQYANSWRSDVFFLNGLNKKSISISYIRIACL